MKIIQTVIDTLREAGIPVMEAYPGLPVPHLTEPTAAVGLEKLDHMGRCAKILVTVMGPATAGGAVCQDVAAQAGRLLEKLDGRCVQEECQFHGYADAFYVRVLADFYGSCVMEEWSDISSFVVKLGNTTVPNAVSFRAEQALEVLARQFGPRLLQTGVDLPAGGGVHQRKVTHAGAGGAVRCDRDAQRHHGDLYGLLLDQHAGGKHSHRTSPGKHRRCSEPQRDHDHLNAAESKLSNPGRGIFRGFAVWQRDTSAAFVLAIWRIMRYNKKWISSET